MIGGFAKPSKNNLATLLCTPDLDGDMISSAIIAVVSSQRSVVNTATTMAIVTAEGIFAKPRTACIAKCQSYYHEMNSNLVHWHVTLYEFKYRSFCETPFHELEDLW